MNLAFCSASVSFTDKVIGIWTRSPYAHVELVFDRDFETDILQLIAAKRLRLLGQRTGTTRLCFSSDGGDKGTRFKWVDLTDTKVWTMVDVPLQGRDLSAATLCGDFDGLAYDWMAIVGFVIPLGEYNPPDRICSGVCAEILIDEGLPIGKSPWRDSPGKLYDAMQKLNGGKK